MDAPRDIPLVRSVVGARLLLSCGELVALVRPLNRWYSPVWSVSQEVEGCTCTERTGAVGECSPRLSRDVCSLGAYEQTMSDGPTTVNSVLFVVYVAAVHAQNKGVPGPASAQCLARKRRKRV